MPVLAQAPAAAAAVAAPVPLDQQIVALKALGEQLGALATYADKIELLQREPAVRAFFKTREGASVAWHLPQLPLKEAYCLVLLPALGQAHVLGVVPTGVVLGEAFERLAAALARVEDFYDSIGGLLGYQLTCLQLIAEQRPSSDSGSGTSCNSSGSASGPSSPGASTTSASSAADGETEYLVPCGLDLASDHPAMAAAARAATAAGISSLPAMAEIYPLGGAGDRLGLACEETGESLPTAVLQYCGRSLLENLVRDLQAREYLYWHLFGVQVTTPLAVMTSAAKGNHWRVQQLFEACAWFGRDRRAVRLFQQPLVPMVAADDGRWLLHKPLQVLMKPGGHGVIWKLMIDEGVFAWLEEQGRAAALVRQISNPLAGTDTTLLALAGEGYPRRRAFGFASCDRVVGASEGVNVLARTRLRRADDGSSSSSGSGDDSGGDRYSLRITNLEYTEFGRLGIADCSVDEDSEHSVFPANTNVLYVGLEAAERTVRASMAASSTEAVLPGMILNLGKKVRYHDAWLGAEREVAAGRLECTMQNLADCLGTELPAGAALEGHAAAEALDTFLVYNQRRKVTSSAKRKLTPGSTRISQTPDGSFYSLQQNAAELLARCGVAAPPLGGVRDYLRRGPGFLFLFHPGLGPMWEVVAHKVQGGALAERAEVQLEVAELSWRDVSVAGSLLVRADTPLGHLEAQQAATGGDGASGANSSGGSSAEEGTHLSLAGLEGLLPPGAASNRLQHLWPPRDGPPGPPAAPALSQPCAGAPHLGAAAAAAAHCSASVGGPQRLVYSDAAPRVRLHNVLVRNRGIDWSSKHNVYWRHKVDRHEACRVLLRGRSEFEARDVTLAGDLTFEVPDGYRMTVSPAGPGADKWRAELVPLDPYAPPSWRWRYSLGQDNVVRLEMDEAPAAPAMPPLP